MRVGEAGKHSRKKLGFRLQAWTHRGGPSLHSLDRLFLNRGDGETRHERVRPSTGAEVVAAPLYITRVAPIAGEPRGCPRQVETGRRLRKNELSVRTHKAPKPDLPSSRPAPGLEDPTYF